MLLSDSVKIISLDRDKLLVQLDQIASRICAERPEVAEIRLFGSLARGDQTGTSDVDVLILLRGTKESDPVRRILEYLPFFEINVGTDLLVYTLAELERYMQEENPFVKRIWGESKSLSDCRVSGDLGS